MALQGLDTYWLAKPLHTGIGHKHNLNIEVGDSQSLRAVLDFTYNQITGVMKGSDRRYCGLPLRFVPVFHSRRIPVGRASKWRGHNLPGAFVVLCHYRMKQNRH